MNRQGFKLFGVIFAVVAFIIAAGPSFASEKSKSSRTTPIVKVVNANKNAVVVVTVPALFGEGEDLGTGVIVDESGVILTCRHVVGHNESPTVKLRDGTTCKAKVLFTDESLDLAAIKIDAGKKKLQTVKFGRSDDLMVGETVIAIGHPYGYKHTVSTGIVSATDRKLDLPGGESIDGVIQVNASINPGNSGGPLLNINGELIGLNCAIRKGAQGIAFTVSIDTIQKKLCDKLSAENHAGVVFGLKCERPAADSDKTNLVVKDCGKADGIKAGDEIVSVGGRTIHTPFDLERAFWSSKAGDSVSVVLKRDGKRVNTTLKLAAAKKDADD